MFIYPEGATPLDPDEAEGLKFKHIETRGELDHLEQANIESGLVWMQRSRRNDFLTEKYVRDLHMQLFGQVWEWAGTFRKTLKSVGIDPMQISVVLHDLLNDINYYISDEVYSPYEIAIRCHHRMVQVHPFPNGNGRFARIHADVLLSKVFKLKPIDWSGGCNLAEMGERRAQYIKSLRAADRGDYRLLYEFAGIAWCER